MINFGQNGSCDQKLLLIKYLLQRLYYLISFLAFTKEKFEAFVKDDPLGAHYATLQANAELALDKLPKMHI